jgi:hypothetical protein
MSIRIAAGSVRRPLRRFLAASAAAQARATLEIRRVELAAAAGRIASSLEQAESSPQP